MKAIPLSLVERVKRDEPRAFEELATLMSTRLNSMVQYAYRFLRATSCGRDILEDIRQEALLALWQAARTFSPERSDDFLEYANWFIWGRLRHFTNRMARLYGKEWPNDPIILVDHPYRTPDEFEGMNDTIISIPMLPEEERQAVSVYITTGSIAATSRVLGVSQVTVRKRLRQALIGLLSNRQEAKNDGEQGSQG